MPSRQLRIAARRVLRGLVAFANNCLFLAMVGCMLRSLESFVPQTLGKTTFVFTPFWPHSEERTLVHTRHQSNWALCPLSRCFARTLSMEAPMSAHRMKTQSLSYLACEANAKFQSALNLDHAALALGGTEPNLHIGNPNNIDDPHADWS